MAKGPIVTKSDREKLVERLKTDPSFRERMKSDWKDAFKDVGINPDDVKGKALEATEVTPFGGDPVMAGIHITIHIMAAAGLERIDLRDEVTFKE